MLTGNIYLNHTCTNNSWAAIINPAAAGYGKALANYFGAAASVTLLPMRIGRRRTVLPLANRLGTGGSWFPASPRRPAD